MTFSSETASGALVVTLFTTTTVSACVAERWAAKTDSVSGFADDVAFTLVSPKPDRLPS